MIRLFLVALVSIGLCAPVLAAENSAETPKFSDVPAEHWAAPAVTQLSEQGIMRGYPDATFKGDRSVTRYELAVALANFVQFIESTRKPILPEPLKDKAHATVDYKSRVNSSKNFLITGNFLPQNSPIISGGSRPVTAEDLAQALASVAARIVELETPDRDSVDLP